MEEGGGITTSARPVPPQGGPSVGAAGNGYGEASAVPPAMERPWSPRAWLLLAVLVLTWGFNYLFVDVGLTSAGPVWLAAMRAGFGFVGTVVLVTVARGWGRLDAIGRRDAMLLGIPNTTLFFGLWFVAARSVPPGIASVVIYTFPLWVAVLSAPVLGRPLGR